MIVDGKDYLACDHCGLRFLHPDYRPNSTAEKTHYDHHNNDIGDAGYRQFLMAVAGPLMAALPKGSSVLDYGAGPGPM